MSIVPAVAAPVQGTRGLSMLVLRIPQIGAVGCANPPRLRFIYIHSVCGGIRECHVDVQGEHQLIKLAKSRTLRED